MNNINVFIKDMFLTSYYPRICWFPSAGYHFSSRTSAVSSLHRSYCTGEAQPMQDMCSCAEADILFGVLMVASLEVWEWYCIHPCS